MINQAATEGAKQNHYGRDQEAQGKSNVRITFLYFIIIYLMTGESGKLLGTIEEQMVTGGVTHGCFEIERVRRRASKQQGRKSVTSSKGGPRRVREKKPQI